MRYWLEYYFEIPHTMVMWIVLGAREVEKEGCRYLGSRW